MTTAREALGLPLMLLTVTLLGGLRIGATVRFLPPALVAVVLGVLLVAALLRAGVLVPATFVRAGRAPLENASGIVVVTSVLAASTQVFNLVTPERGLLHAIFSAFFLVQLLTTLAGVQERRALLRTLLVLLGSAFVLRFVVLEAIYAKEGGTLTRVLTSLLEGVSLGALQYEPNAASTGYLAFLGLALYLTALFLLEAGPDRRSGPLVPRNGRGTDVIRTVSAIALLLALGGCHSKAAHPEAAAGSGLVPEAVRDRALRGARVWHPPAVPVSSAALAQNPPGGFSADDEISCRFLLQKVGGTTPKFNCELPGGEIVKVKYGETNAELHAEVAATRLLAALGFGADRMFVVRAVNCAGCPPIPFTVLRCLAETGLESACVPGGIDYSKSRRFETVVVERRVAGRAIEAKPDQGWAWFELDRVDPAAGGSPRADVDALRLMAVLLAHWDNKAENQRLVCPADRDVPGGGCDEPLALIQDLGGTFGPTKIDLRNWRGTPVWTDASACRVSMEDLPFGGGTFPKAQISEEGRRRLLELLTQLTDAQLTDLFRGSRITTFDGLSVEARDPSAWVLAFQEKVQQIRAAGPCPAAAALSASPGK